MQSFGGGGDPFRGLLGPQMRPGDAIGLFLLAWMGHAAGGYAEYAVADERFCLALPSKGLCFL